MNVFVVVFTTASDEAAKRLRDEYPDAYELVPTTAYLVRSEELSSDVAAKVGIKSDPRITGGVVFKANHAYSGYTKRTLWEWLGD